MKHSPAHIFARIIRSDPDAVARLLAENVEALVGGKVTMELVPGNGPECAQLFGERELYVFPVEDSSGTPFPSLLAFDLEAAVYTGGAFSLMGVEQIKEVLGTGEIPEGLHDSIGEVANILCGAAVQMIRGRVAEAPQFRRGAGFQKKRVGPWPALLAEFGPRVPWEIVACRLSMNDESRGAIFFGASDGKTGRVTGEEIEAVAGPGPKPDWAAAGQEAVGVDVAHAPEAGPEAQEDEERNFPPLEGNDDESSRAAAAPPPPRPAAGRAEPLSDSIRVLVTGNPADPQAAALRSALEATGVRLMPTLTVLTEQSHPPDALFVVSRSPTDLSIRLERVPQGRRPALVVACSDRPTRELVIAARANGADHFLVLPVGPERLRELLSRIPVTA